MEKRFEERRELIKKEMEAQGIPEIKFEIRPSTIEFEDWWHCIGSGIIPKEDEDTEEFAKRISFETYWHFKK